MELLKALREARESYERKKGCRENLWKGLVNRWNKAHAFALELLDGTKGQESATGVKPPASTKAEAGLNPPLCYATKQYSEMTKRFQVFANQVAGVKLDQDGRSGKKTSDVFHLLTGYYLAHNPRLG